VAPAGHCSSNGEDGIAGVRPWGLCVIGHLSATPDGFERLPAEPRTAEPARARALLGQALGLWRGEPLAFAPFAHAEIVRLGELRLAAIEGRAVVAHAAKPQAARQANDRSRTRREGDALGSASPAAGPAALGNPASQWGCASWWSGRQPRIDRARSRASTWAVALSVAGPW
jgi:Bacterial transcriptional activator domain